MKSGASMLAGALLVGCSCIYVPYKAPTTGSRLDPAGATLDQAREARTREDVLLALGEPDWVMKEGRLFLYTWQDEWGWVVSPLTKDYGPVYGVRRFLVVEFDPNGAVLRSRIVDGVLGRLGPEVETW